MIVRRSSLLASLLACAGLSLVTSACNNGAGSRSSGASTAAPATSATTSTVKSATTGTVKSSSTSTSTATSRSGSVVHPTTGPGKIAPVASATTTPVSSATAPVSSASATVALGPDASRQLYVACSNDRITAFDLDPTLGVPSNPRDTDLGLGGTFYPAGIAADGSGATVFVTGATSILALGANAGTLTLPTAGLATNPLKTSVAGAARVLVLPGTSTVLAGDANPFAGPGALEAFASQTAPNAIVLESAGLEAVGTNGGPASLAVDANGAWVYFTNVYDGNVQTAAITTSATAVTFGTATPAVTDLAWTASYASPACCVLVSQAGGDALLTGNNDGTISAFPLSAPGALAAATTVSTPAKSSTGWNSISGIAVDSTGQLLVASDSAANRLFAFGVTVSNGAVTLAPLGVGAGPIPSATSVVWNADGPVCYAVDNNYFAGNATVSYVHAYAVGAQGLTPIGAGPVAFPDPADSPVALAVSR